MRKIILIYIILFLAMPGNGFAWTGNNLPEAERGVQPWITESVVLFTDRTLFISGEDILFEACVSQSVGKDIEQLSDIIYTELIRWNGTKISQAKTALSDYRSTGSLHIPEEIESGTYYVRSYTKWMRNYSPYEYAYKTVKVVNPFRKETDKGPDEEIDTELTEGSVNTIRMLPPNDMELQPDYGRREQVTFVIPDLPELIPGDYCLSVVKSGSYFPMPELTESGAQEENDAIGSPVYYPEIRGLSVSGKLIDKDSGKGISNRTVYLSSTINPFYLSAYDTDTSGIFLFTFPPHNGTAELCVTVDSLEDSGIDLNIDSEYCKRNIALPYIPFSLEDSERDLLIDMARNLQLAGNVVSDVEAFLFSDSVQVPFYGRPTRIIYEKNYIELDNIEEFIFELVPEVNVQRTRGEIELSMTGVSSLSIAPVLVMMDNIPVSDIEELLKISCRRINRIELVNTGYVIGNTKYSGLLNIFSEGRDIAGLSFESTSKFFNYSMITSSTFSNPTYDTPEKINYPAPDRRNTLYWNPSIKVGEMQSPGIEFYTGDSPGQYSVILQSLDQPGEVYSLGQFTVE